jgi:hypothetical protein
MPYATLLSIDGIDLGDYATRGLSQTLTPIPASAVIRRTVNGTARNVAGLQFQKYSTKITCRDQEGPGFIDVWPGKLITITCLPDMAGGYPEDQESPLVLYCMVEAWDVDKDEAGHMVGWSLSAVEV